jgi:hypothetical protein
MIKNKKKVKKNNLDDQNYNTISKDFIIIKKY